MGVYQSLTVCPDRIPDGQWEEVYEEALRIVERCNFLDRIILKRNGQRYAAARKTAERGLPEEGPGIYICGTMASGADMEEFTLPRRKPRCHSSDGPDNGVDILFRKQWSDDPEIPRPTAVRCVWAAKTQGGPGHIPLLAIACLFADRFPEAVMIDGDITAGQCRAAVRLDNQCLDRPVQIPVTCRAEALILRLQGSGIPVRKQLEEFFGLYLGKLTPIVGGVLKKCFPKEELYQYFRELVTREGPEKVTFTSGFRDYLLLDLDLADLLKMLVQDSEGPQLPLEMVLSELFERRVHIPMEDKNSFDPLGLDTALDGDEEEPHDIKAIMGRAFFAMSVGSNRTLPVYVPLERIRDACHQGLPSGDTDTLIDRLLKELTTDERHELVYGNNDTALLNLFRTETETYLDSISSYDIREYQDLFCWEPGLTIEPKLKDNLLTLMGSVKKFSPEQRFQEFLALDRAGRENYFTRSNRRILIYETTWNHIFSRVMDDSYIYRYFLLSRVNCSDSQIHDVMSALLSKPSLIDLLWEQAADELAETEK